MSVVKIPGKLVNKANEYQLRFHKGFWLDIQSIVKSWRDAKVRPYWIGPSGDSDAYQDEVAYRFLQQERREWLNNEPLQLHIRLIGQPHDVDCAKGIQDAIQKSKRICNDKQFRKIIIEHVAGKTPSVELEVSEYGSDREGQ